MIITTTKETVPRDNHLSGIKRILFFNITSITPQWFWVTTKWQYNYYTIIWRCYVIFNIQIKIDAEYQDMLPRQSRFVRNLGWSRYSAHILICWSQLIYLDKMGLSLSHMKTTWRLLIARFMGLTWGLPGADRTQVGPILAPMNLAIWDYFKLTKELINFWHVFHILSADT